MIQNPRDRKWYSIAEQASREMDSAKLTILVAQLCSALDERENPPALRTQFCAESNSPNVRM
jgi:hypothetical protein